MRCTVDEQQHPFQLDVQPLATGLWQVVIGRKAALPPSYDPLQHTSPPRASLDNAPPFLRATLPTEEVARAVGHLALDALVTDWLANAQARWQLACEGWLSSVVAARPTDALCVLLMVVTAISGDQRYLRVDGKGVYGAPSTGFGVRLVGASPYAALPSSLTVRVAQMAAGGIDVQLRDEVTGASFTTTLEV